LRLSPNFGTPLALTNGSSVRREVGLILVGKVFDSFILYSIIDVGHLMKPITFLPICSVTTISFFLNCLICNYHINYIFKFCLKQVHYVTVKISGLSGQRSVMLKCLCCLQDHTAATFLLPALAACPLPT